MRDGAGGLLQPIGAIDGAPGPDGIPADCRPGCNAALPPDGLADRGSRAHCGAMRTTDEGAGLTRRTVLAGLAGATAAGLPGCGATTPGSAESETVMQPPTPQTDVVMTVKPLGRPPWDTLDPFLFCVHHDDAYPAGDERMGPAASLAGRDIGQDFAGIDGWRMYHGDVIPGFPQHPHRGFETVTVTRRGFIDHSDSLGATARYGAGDVQWLTAGAGIVHAEMFPLIEREASNPLELFQIWLNLPAVDKMAAPHFAMFWRDAVPVISTQDAAGRTTRVTVVAGRLGEATPQSPPPKSWAARADSDVAIWAITMAPGATWTLPAALPGSDRMLYAFRGDGLQIGPRAVPGGSAARLKGSATTLVNGAATSELLLLQGRPIGEPVAAYGPFVMNTRAEIQQAYSDYQRTRFGGWPWPSDGPAHPRGEGRFAIHADGRTERVG
jgi:redox-sensitive bicupin YhaK (pirin superfamily)